MVSDYLWFRLLSRDAAAGSQACAPVIAATSILARCSAAAWLGAANLRKEKPLMRILAGLLVSFIVASTGRAQAPGSFPLPVPLTRPEMKQALEVLKHRKPRIPLPELSEEEKQKLGERGASYENRLRYHYLPGGDVRGGTWLLRDPDPNMSLDYAFKTQLFWIVSRANNCHY
jgi:hypothetical protein